MSKKKHKSRDANNNRNGNMNNQNNSYNMNNPFGINPAQLLSLFGGADISQLGNMLSFMGRDGFDFSGLGGMGQNLNNSSYNNMETNYNNQTTSEINDDEENFFDNERHNDTNGYDVKDDNIEFLKSIRSIVDPRRTKLIDKIIEKYLDGEFDE